MSKQGLTEEQRASMACGHLLPKCVLASDNAFSPNQHRVPSADGTYVPKWERLYVDVSRKSKIFTIHVVSVLDASSTTRPVVCGPDGAGARFVEPGAPGISAPRSWTSAMAGITSRPGGTGQPAPAYLLAIDLMLTIAPARANGDVLRASGIYYDMGAIPEWSKLCRLLEEVALDEELEAFQDGVMLLTDFGFEKGS